jgi:dihydrofolate synthase/folylpolyglutamate synthase
MGYASNLLWWEETKSLGSHPGLESIDLVLKLLSSPQNDFKSIHVTGTNGKGSTSAMVASILRSSGYNVGLFTSPYLSHWSENIVVNGVEITEEQMETILGAVREKVNQIDDTGERYLTHFEILVAACFLYFKERGVDYAVIEVGMGGRNDATNVIPSSVSIVTNVSLEHTAWLGDTVEKIAENKSDILRRGTSLVTASINPQVINILERVAKEKNSQLIRVGKDYIPVPTRVSLTEQSFQLVTPSGQISNLEIPLLGTHQLLNASCAVAAVQSLDDPRVTDSAIRDGLRSVIWPGRFEIIEKKPLIILDGAKDSHAIQKLSETVKTFLPGLDLFTIISISNDKDYSLMVRYLADITGRFILTEHRVKSRTATTEQLEEVIKKTGVPYEIVLPVHNAIESAKSHAMDEDAILITGSVFLVGEAREYWFPTHSRSSG